VKRESRKAVTHKTASGLEAVFFVRKFPTGKSEFSPLILQALPGNMQQIFVRGKMFDDNGVSCF
jgi:hypothetical protein